MAGKRGASSDLNHDNWDDEVEGEEAGTFTPAGSDVLKGRVIKKAKRRGGQESQPNVFAGFGGFQSAAPAAASALGAASFDFLSKDSKNGSESSGKSANTGFSFSAPKDASEAKVPPVFAFGMGSAPRDSTFAIKSPATGFTFGGAATQAKPSEPDKKPASGFVFGEAPEKKSTETSGFSFGTGASAKPAEPAKTSFARDEPVSSGFNFGAANTSSDASFGAKPGAFGFGAKTTEPTKPTFTPVETVTTSTTSKSTSIKESSQGSGAPQPSLMDLFKPKTGSWVCSVCDVLNDSTKAECVACTTPKPGGLSATKPAAKKWECPTCMVYNDPDKDRCVCCETQQPGTISNTTKSSTGFGSSSFSSSGFQFGSQSTDSSGSGFKLGDSAGTKTGSSFKFGSSGSTASDQKDGEYPREFLADLKALNTGVMNWIQTHVERNAYVYLSPVFRDYDKHLSEIKQKHKIKDGSTVNNSNSTGFGSEVKTGSGFQFGSNGASNTDTKISTKKPDVTPEEKLPSPKAPQNKTGFTFESSGTSASKTGFSLESSSTTKPPSFTFGSAGSTDAKSGFSFDAKTTEPKSGFTFGASAAGAKPAPAPETAKPSSGFTFGSSEVKSGFTFGSGSATGESKTGFTFGSGATGESKPGFTFGGAASTFGSFSSVNKPAAESKEDNDDEEEDEPPKVEVAPIVEEDSIYSIRCKIFYKKGKEFVDKGVGMLYLKPVEGTKKTQVLVRAETSLGNILLNVMLNKQMSILKRGNNLQFVCIPNPPIPGIESGPVTMLVKVKNSELADELEAKMQERLKQEQE